VCGFCGGYGEQFFTIHEGWLVYGNNNQLICTVKRTTPSRIAPELIPSMDVFLASNTTEVVPDFQLKGSFFERSLTLLRRGQVLAQVCMYNNQNALTSHNFVVVYIIFFLLKPTGF
jgi:hypothetical protein